MKINAFKVVARGDVQLDTVLSYLATQGLQSKLRDIYGTRMRLEEAQKDKTGIWRLDFAKIRKIGPGRVSESKPIEDFDLDHDEGFGEETAGYYDATTGYLMLQYNHHGPRSSTIQSYFFRYALASVGKPEVDEPPDSPDGFTLAAVLRKDASARLRRMQIVKMIGPHRVVRGEC